MRSIKGTKLFSAKEIKEATELLREGKLVAFPTETVYGLGANALDEGAVKAIFTAKGRPSDNPLIIHIGEEEDIEDLISGRVPQLAEKLINKFWPGPLTLILPKAKKVPDITTGGLNTVAVRMPNHPIALKLIKETGLPLAAPSANLSGKPSPTLVEHVIEDLAGRIAGIVDGGQTGLGVESTVIDLSREVPTLLRPGGVTYEELLEELGEIEIDPVVKSKFADESKAAISPGMKYRHYAPQAEVVLIEGKEDKIKDKIKELITANVDKKIGVMVSKELEDSYLGSNVKIMGSKDNLIEISQSIFKLLREFDEEGVEKILIEGLQLEGLGLAIMNRLRKSAAYQIVEV
ncbi:threonylcarbamoyl-AMP synthase [Orenia metallireducens]|uniref:Threonylcarbamoyl-AMP synthase n=1 Tax=Orenia metallireducens TaxID=1413210 RepID=A0A1C0A688_9FIRM|nr:L-threonylcarbamoyladenylate synthase [Orenia metallireducens]OCL25661.1 threonylcarbamoyl-AMP synthase [Orenia metallireducens]